METTISPGLSLLPVERATALIARLGFVLVHDQRAGDAAMPSGSHLVIALRDQPTLTHFDPERVTWFVTSGGKGQAVEFHRSRALIDRMDIAWGHVHLFDRLEVQNAFLTFGGVVRTAQTDPRTTLVLIDSPVSMLRWTGHSQDVDLVAPEVAAFFARLLVPIDFTPGAEARISALSPMALYGAFVADLRGRYQASRVLRQAHPQLDQWLAHEAHRLESAWADDWEAGRRMLSDLSLTAF
ncbi:MAG TPA: hypothetical protein VN800_04275 [Candidatus Acidoferrales bacterium]|nr:hypothetical protein [Candidatus Acidoferrales bacterium]